MRSVDYTVRTAVRYIGRERQLLINKLTQLTEAKYLDNLFQISAKEAAKLDIARCIYELRYINGYEHRIDFWYSLCDMSTGQCKLLQKPNSQLVYDKASDRMEWFRMGKIYRVKEEFTMYKTWYGDTLGSGGIAHVGDLFELDNEPEHKKKLYRLTKINTKFPFRLQIRPNDFKRYFELVEGEESS